MFVPKELLFNIFLSYPRMGSFSHRSAAFQTQMGFIGVSAALTSLTFHGTAPAPTPRQVPINGLMAAQVSLH